MHAKRYISTPGGVGCKLQSVNFRTKVRFLNPAAPGSVGYVPCRSMQSFESLKESAEDGYSRALSLLPSLQRALNAAESARVPAAEADVAWQEAYNTLTSIQGEAHDMQKELKDKSLEAFGGPVLMAEALLRHHVAQRIQTYRNETSDVTFWEALAQNSSRLEWLPGATMLTQIAVMVVENVPCVVGCVAVCMPLDSSLRDVVIHWSVAENSFAPWAKRIPNGWRTCPDVSHPRGSSAWETPMSIHAPVIRGESITSTVVHSVLLQIPLEDFLDSGGGIKFVLRRADGGHPEWIKLGDHIDFWLDFEPALTTLSSLIKSENASVASTEGVAVAQSNSVGLKKLSSRHVDSLDEWGWARALGTSSNTNQESIRSASKTQGKELFYGRTEILRYTASIVEEAYKHWAEAIERWDQLGDFPPRQPPSLSRQVKEAQIILSTFKEDLDAVLFDLERAKKLLQDEGQIAIPADLQEEMLERWRKDIQRQSQIVSDVLKKTEEVDDTLLNSYDAAALKSRTTQQERERLWEIYTHAKDEAHHLQMEALSATDKARKDLGTLRGRSQEIGKEELSALAYHIVKANNTSSSAWSSLWPFGTGRQSVFVQQKAFQTGGINGSMIAQIYLEGDSNKIRKVFEDYRMIYSHDHKGDAGEEENVLIALERDFVKTVLDRVMEKNKLSGAQASSNDTLSKTKGTSKHSQVFDTVIVSIAMGEAFPNGNLRAPVMLHMGSVVHQGAKWRPLPHGWTADNDSNTAEECQGADQLPWIPMKTFEMSESDGTPAAVDPLLHAICIRIPLVEISKSGVKGLELVFKTSDGRWIQLHGGGNFHVEIPVSAVSKS